eukprot:c23561_g1_i1 orf=1-417(-)
MRPSYLADGAASFESSCTSIELRSFGLLLPLRISFLRLDLLLSPRHWIDREQPIHSSNPSPARARFSCGLSLQTEHQTMPRSSPSSSPRNHLGFKTKSIFSLHSHTHIQWAFSFHPCSNMNSNMNTRFSTTSNSFQKIH